MKRIGVLIDSTNCDKYLFESFSKLCTPSAPMVVGMYDAIGHFVYFESHGGLSNEGERKRD